MLEKNRRRVQNLTGLEIWLFIVGRCLLAFAVGVLSTEIAPAYSAMAVWPAMGAGSVLLIIASLGMFRKSASE